MKKETYYKRKEQGICVKCGKNPPHSDTGTYCEECLNKRKQGRHTDSYENYHFYRDNGICPRCLKNQTFCGRVFCPECSEKENKRRREQKKTEEQHRKDREKYHTLKENGICTHCKHRQATTGYTTCELCRTRIKGKRRSKGGIPRSEWVSYGICYLCGKQQVIDGKKVCPDCYKTRLNSIRKICYLPGNKNWKNDNNLVFRIGTNDGTIQRNMDSSVEFSEEIPSGSE